MATTRGGGDRSGGADPARLGPITADLGRRKAGDPGGGDRLHPPTTPCICVIGLPFTGQQKFTQPPTRRAERVTKRRYADRFGSPGAGHHPARREEGEGQGLGPEPRRTPGGAASGGRPRPHCPVTRAAPLAGPGPGREDARNPWGLRGRACCDSGGRGTRPPGLRPGGRTRRGFYRISTIGEARSGGWCPGRP